MPIYLKLVKGSGEKGDIMELGFCMDNDEDISIDTETALNESFTITPETLERMKKLIKYGQMYEAVDKSHKSEFKDLEGPED
jgi:sulfur transfer protein SufE